MLETMPKKRLNKTFGNGPGVDTNEVAMSDQDKEFIRLQGHDPEAVMAAITAKDSADYEKATAKAS
jgi:hypothetical protein